MTRPTDNLSRTIERGVAYLAAAQRPDGGFDSYSSPSATASDFRPVYRYNTTFAPSIMLAALSGLDSEAGQRIRKRLTSFLKAQASSRGSFNYWAKSAPERRNLPYPDDLDDTACALIGLFLDDPTSLQPAELAAFVKLLLATETTPGGPYRTWLVANGSDPAWLDVDLAVNANINYCLSLVSRPLPHLIELMERSIRQERLTSPYYYSSYPLVYYLSRSYQGPLTRQLLDTVRRLSRPTEKLTALPAALSLSARLRLGDSRAGSLVNRLLDGQQSDGSWPAEAFCLDPTRGGVTRYNGSAGLTTALALEALSAYQSALAAGRTANNARPAKQAYGLKGRTAFEAKIMTAARRDWRSLKPELRDSGLDFTKRLIRSSGSQEITSLPHAFNLSLAWPLRPAGEPALVQLGLANLYGWIAYTIYDDFLDDEGQPRLLPVANKALRRSLAAFHKALPSDADFQVLVSQTFDAIDEANAWELAHCRLQYLAKSDELIIESLPFYDDPARLAERSLGHSLTPLAVLRAMNIELDSALFNGVRRALVHYLAARQLNDDAHDWQTDLSKGHLTYVATKVLKDASIGPGRYEWTALLPLLQRQFWHHSLPEVCEDIRQQIELSRCSLNGLDQLQTPNILTELIDGIETSLAETLTSQRAARAFLKHYGQPASKEPAHER